MNLFASMNFLLAAAPGLLASNVSAIGQVLGRNHQEASGSVVADTPEHATKGYQVSTLETAPFRAYIDWHTDSDVEVIIAYRCTLGEKCHQTVSPFSAPIRAKQ